MSAPTPDDRGENRVPHVEFEGVDKSYDGENLVVRGLDLAVERGEFLTLLGPSGSGKTTCLMMLAGFEAPTAGTIRIAGRPIQDLPPHKRGIGMVFQNYALFPHMTVGGNLAFPLEVRGVEPALRRERVSGLSAWCNWRDSRTGGRRSSRAVSSNGWRSPARSCSSRRSS